MRINVTFRHTEPTEALKKYAEEKVRKLTKILDRPQEANVILSVEKIRHIAEVIIVADGFTTTGKEATNDLYNSIDKVFDKIERRLKKGKSKRQTLKIGKGGHSKAGLAAEEKPAPKAQRHEAKSVSEKSSGIPSIVESDLFLPKPMAVEDAAAELVAGKLPLVVFRNSITMEVCVLHKNPDGTLGLVEPVEE